MSDSSTTALDPKRPWLTDERELPHRMNWFQVLFNPTEPSPRLHFTRAWTLLFTLQLLIIVLPWTIALILNVGGGDGKPVGAFGVYATPVVFIATTLMSYVIHSRRLLDAGKSQLLAIIPLVPLVLGMVFFMMGAAQQAAQYDKRFEMRQDFLADPDAFRAKQLAEQQKAREEAEKRAAEAAAAKEGDEASGEGEQASGEGAPQQQRRRAGGGRGMNLEQPLPPKHEAVLKAALPSIQMVIIPLSGLIAIWSLMWVARAPYFGRYPGDEGVASAEERRAYEV